MPEQSHYDRVRSLKKHLAEKTGLNEGYDTYYYLARMGSNYDKYGFQWEPFRDLAGPLEVGANALPLVVMSDDRQRSKPEVLNVEEPIRHFQLWVSPSCPAASVANAWLELLTDNSASHTSYKGPFDWFPRALELSAEDLSEKGRSFLSL